MLFLLTQASNRNKMKNTEINSVSYMEEMPKTFKYYMLKTKMELHHIHMN